MKKNLPVKYGLLPILDFDKIIGNICVKNIRIIGYAVCECYVVAEHTRYCDDNSIKKDYDVIFPYCEIYYNNKVQPVENNYNNYTTNNVKVLFDNYKDAKELCKKKNYELIKQEKKEINEYNNRIDIIESDAKALVRRKNI